MIEAQADFSLKDYARSVAKKFTGVDAYQRERRGGPIDGATMMAGLQIAFPAIYSGTFERPHHKRNRLSVISLHLAVLADAGVSIGAFISAYELNPEIAFGIKTAWNTLMAFHNAHAYRPNQAFSQADYDLVNHH